MADSKPNSDGKLPDAGRRIGWLGRWQSLPLYWRILMAMVLGLVCGLVLQERAAFLEIPSKIILQLLGALAPPLILVAVTHVLMTSEITGRMAARLGGLLLLNTTVAIVIGLAVANTIQPGKIADVDPPDVAAEHEAGGANPFQILVQNVPKSILGPLGDKTNVIGIIIIAIAFGVVLRDMKDRPLRNILDLVEIAYQSLVTVLHWIIHLVPFGVFAIVANVVGTQGFGVFKALAVFILSVLLALALQTCWYLVRIQACSWVKPLDMLRGMRDALVMAFSTDSSTVTMPVTYACLTEKVGLREESASMGALVGANFNNDGTALYEAMAALFVAQLIGQDLTIWQQLIIVATSIIASVGAAGIPEAGLVTMTLVFNAVGLPISYIAILLTVDWFLDRCRTTINVLGDVNVSCILDGKVAPTTIEAGGEAAVT
jgi:DAACS family dicarboxylate/amino acid:cation (Na+ or H+) symporter